MSSLTMLSYLCLGSDHDDKKKASVDVNTRVLLPWSLISSTGREPHGSGNMLGKKLHYRFFYKDRSGFKISCYYSYDQTNSCLSTKRLHCNWIDWIANLLEFEFDNGFVAHTHIYLSTSAALQNRVLKPTYTYAVFQAANL